MESKNIIPDRLTREDLPSPGMNRILINESKRDRWMPIVIPNVLGLFVGLIGVFLYHYFSAVSLRTLLGSVSSLKLRKTG